MAKYEIKEGVGIIPEGTTKIEDKAFEGCTDLNSVVILDSVTEIGMEAFVGCSNLKKVIVPSSVTTIGQGAFWGCENLTEIVIPKSVSKIEPSIFGGCARLKSIVVDQGNKTYDSRDNCNAIVETATNCLVASCTKTTIPTSVTEIGPAAFHKCSSLTEISIPSHMTKIGSDAFSQCENLKKVTIPNSVTEIGEYAFCACESLGSVTIPDSVSKIAEGTFYQCSGLTSITLPNSIKEIGTGAFSECSSLSSITIPDSVTEIEDQTFFKCTSLTDITLPSSVKTIGNGAFAITSLRTITIPDSVVKIDKNAFAVCYQLKSISLPDSVTEIGENAFKSAKALKTIQVPKGKEDKFKKLLPEELHNLIGKKVEDASPVAQATEETPEELCKKIKKELDKQGKQSFIMYAAKTNKKVKKSDIDEDEYIDNYYIDCRLALFDAGNYSRIVSVDGVLIEDGNLKFYLSIYHCDDNGDDYQESWKDDLNGMLDGWWNKSQDFRPTAVLNAYLEAISSFDAK